MPRPAIIWSAAYEVDIGEHVFPTVKYRRVRERLLDRGVVSPEDFLEPEPATREELSRVHTDGYLEKVDRGDFTYAELLRLEVPFSPALREAMTLCCGGTIRAGRRAVEDGIAVHLGGGFHHAFSDHGEGFCLLNDVAVGAASVLATGHAERVAVVDLDVHHGNGTAAIFSDEPRVFTFSMHQERNYPHPKPPGDLDVGLEDGTGDETYLGLLRRHLPGIVGGHDPDLVYYLAGADPYREDQLGGLALTVEGLRARDDYVLTTCRDEGTPVSLLPAGGYAVQEADTVGLHAGSVEAAMAAVRER